MKYIVTVAVTFHKELTIYAKSESEAEDKAVEIAEGWNNVESAETIEVEEAE